MVGNHTIHGLTHNISRAVGSDILAWTYCNALYPSAQSASNGGVIIEFKASALGGLCWSGTAVVWLLSIGSASLRA
jgi:hypothetical protein